MSIQAELASDFNYEELLDNAALQRVASNHGLFLRSLEGKELTPYITQHEALEVLGDSLDAHQIASFITFSNSHLVAQALTSNPEAARALYEELAYWTDKGQI